jgi:hypothetical protein
MGLSRSIGMLMKATFVALAICIILLFALHVVARVKPALFIGEFEFLISPIDDRKKAITLTLQPTDLVITASPDSVMVSITVSPIDLAGSVDHLITPLKNDLGKTKNYKLVDDYCNIYLRGNTSAIIRSDADGRTLIVDAKVDLEFEQACKVIGDGVKAASFPLPVRFEKLKLVFTPRLPKIELEGVIGKIVEHELKSRVNDMFRKHDQEIELLPGAIDAGVELTSYRFSGSSQTDDLEATFTLSFPWFSLPFIYRQIYAAELK